MIVNIPTQSLSIYFVFKWLCQFVITFVMMVQYPPHLTPTGRSDSRADDGYDDVTLVVTAGTRGYCKAECKLCLLWTDCCHVGRLNGRPAFCPVPRLDGRSPRKSRGSLRALCPCLVLKHAAKSEHDNGRCCDVFIYIRPYVLQGYNFCPRSWDYICEGP